MRQTIENLKSKLGFTSDAQLAEFLGSCRQGAIQRMKKGIAGKNISRPYQVISGLLDEMSHLQIKKAVKKLPPI